MGLFNKGNNKKKQADKILNDLVGGMMPTSARRKFYKRMTDKGITGLPMEKARSNVLKTIKSEVENDKLEPTTEAIDQRIDEILDEHAENLVAEREVQDAKVKENVENTILQRKEKILNKRSIGIDIPYTSSGVSNTIVGGSFLGGTGAVLGSLNEGATKWKHTKLLLNTDNLAVKSTGYVVLYEDIKKVVISGNSFAHSNMVIITHSGENFVFRTIRADAVPCKNAIEDIISEVSDNVPDNNGQSNTGKVNFCPNCGVELTTETNFCPNCGFKIVK